MTFQDGLFLVTKSDGHYVVLHFKARDVVIKATEPPVNTQYGFVAKGVPTDYELAAFGEPEKMITIAPDHEAIKELKAPTAREILQAVLAYLNGKTVVSVAAAKPPEGARRRVRQLDDWRT